MEIELGLFLIVAIIISGYYKFIIGINMDVFIFSIGGLIGYIAAKIIIYFLNL